MPTAKIYQFPLRNTKFMQWYNLAVDMYSKSNATGLRVWAAKNIPRQFRTFIIQEALASGGRRER